MPKTVQEKAEAFRALHTRDGCFVMPNAWNAGSARVLADLGFPALGTTSAGIAFCLGRPDYDRRVSRDEMMAELARIAAAVDLPVSADLEAGYGPRPEDVAETVHLSIAAGMAGGSIEDYTGDPANPLFEPAEAVARVAAAREAADASGLPYVLTGRAECYLVGHPEPFAESVRRLNLYRAAGADCLYAPGLTDPEEIGALVRAVEGPVNIVVGLAGGPLTVEALGELGVRRISVGGALARASFGALRRGAEEIRDRGTFEFSRAAIPDAELSALFAGPDDVDPQPAYLLRGDRK